MRKTPFALLAVAVFGLATFAHADVSIIDYQGYAWETGGLPPSNVNDELNIVGITVDIDAIFGIDIVTPVEEVTIWATDLISLGQVDLGGGLLGITYAGGILEVWNDAALNHDFGTNPPNGTAPSTFVDGSLLLGGTFDDFILYYDTNSGAGFYEGHVTWNAGSALGAITGIQNDGFTFGGTLDSSLGEVLEGYDLQVDGVIEIMVETAVEEKTWGEVKGLFR